MSPREPLSTHAQLSAVMLVATLTSPASPYAVDGIPNILVLDGAFTGKKIHVHIIICDVNMCVVNKE